MRGRRLEIVKKLVEIDEKDSECCKISVIIDGFEGGIDFTCS